MRVMLVEDNDDSRELYRRMLEQLGHQVIEATNGKEAIRVAIKQNPEMVIMDLSMPEVDGFQATSALRSIRNFNRIPILAITRLRFGEIAGYTFVVAAACFAVSSVAMWLIPPNL